MLSGNIDPNHMGRITLGIHSDNTLEIEEAFFTNTGLALVLMLLLVEFYLLLDTLMNNIVILGISQTHLLLIRHFGVKKDIETMEYS